MVKKTERCKGTADIFGQVLDAKQVKEIIGGLGWSQKEIAEYWGMSTVWISNLVQNKNGERSIRDDCAFRGLPRKN
ncbi:MAG: hypothetical protein RPS47_18045 [Colwellia sp.]|jgi:hypothetical protein